MEISNQIIYNEAHEADNDKHYQWSFTPRPPKSSLIHDMFPASPYNDLFGLCIFVDTVRIRLESILILN